MSSPAPPLSLVAKALAGAWAARHPGAASSPASLAMALSWSIGEGAWTAWQENGEDVYPFQGTNNFGSIHATRRFAESHADGGGFGMVAFLDHAPGAYVTRMAVYPSLDKGADGYLAIVETFVDLASVSSTTDYSASLYVHNYFEGFHPNRTAVAGRAAARAGDSWTDDDRANIADGAALLGAHMAAARAAMAAAGDEPGDPTVESHGPPFAPLGVRLTPAQKWAPHTLEHARELLGDAADNPRAGGISLQDALETSGADGVWMFPEGVYTPETPQAPAKPPMVPERVAVAASAWSAVAGAVLGIAAAVGIAQWTGLVDWRTAFAGVGRAARA